MREQKHKELVPAQKNYSDGFGYLIIALQGELPGSCVLLVNHSSLLSLLPAILINITQYNLSLQQVVSSMPSLTSGFHMLFICQRASIAQV